ncbi:MAG: hypothetical protein II304_11430 [Bacteroidales bacterium]|nr:hypothetical protein [Bacteroidales bacterium]
MAKQLQNNKGFLVIQMPWREYVAITDSFGQCFCCGDYDSDMIFYYVATVDSFFCPKCYELWYSSAVNYKVDRPKEQYNFVSIKNKIKDLGSWEND